MSLTSSSSSSMPPLPPPIAKMELGIAGLGFVSKAIFLRDWVPPRRSKGSSRSTVAWPVGSVRDEVTNSLEVIPEMGEIEVGLETREVTIVSLFEPFSGFMERHIVEEVAKEMHRAIVGNVKFTAMKHGGDILAEAFECAEKELKSLTNLDVSCVVAMISGNEACLAYLGDCHAVLCDQDGRVAPILKKRFFRSGLGSSTLPEMLHFQLLLSSQQLITNSPPKKPRSLKRVVPNIFHKDSDGDGNTKSVVLAIVSSDIWADLGSEKLMITVKKSLESGRQTIQQTTENLVKKARKQRPGQHSACIIRWLI